MNRKEHKWVEYKNPRNGKVTVSACYYCGMSKNPVNSLRPCQKVKSSEHQLRRLGWIRLSTRHSHRAASNHSAARAAA